MSPALKLKAAAGTLVLLLIGYTALWYTAAFDARKDLAATLSTWRDSGLRVEHEAIQLSGFPYRFILQVPDIIVATRQGGLTFDSKALTLVSHLWTPDHWIAEATDTRVSVAGGAFVFEEDFMQASYRVHGGDKLVIKIDSAGGEDFKWVNGHGLPTPDAWTLMLGHDDSAAESRSGLYESRSIEFKLYGDYAGAVIDITGGLTGNPIRDWTPSELAAWRDEGGLIDIDALSWQAEDMNVSLKGDVTLDELLRPLGSASVSIEGWETFTKLAPRIGLLPADEAPSDPALTMQNGLVTLGGQTIGRVLPFF